MPLSFLYKRIIKMAKKTDKPQKKTQEKKLVKMEHPNGIQADVHPDMVDEYKIGGYKVVNNGHS